MCGPSYNHKITGNDSVTKLQLKVNKDGTLRLKNCVKHEGAWCDVAREDTIHFILKPGDNGVTLNLLNKHENKISVKFNSTTAKKIEPGKSKKDTLCQNTKDYKLEVKVHHSPAGPGGNITPKINISPSGNKFGKVWRVMSWQLARMRSIARCVARAGTRF